MHTDIGWFEAVASLSLVAVVVGISLWRRLGIERTLLWASARAATQLLAVGLVFNLIFESDQAMTWAWIWIVGMALVSAEVVRYRVQDIPGLRGFALVSLGGGLVVTLGLLFGLDTFDLQPVTLVVLAGITLGNTMPATVQAATMITTEFGEHRGRVEALLALGFDRRGAARQVTAVAVRQALIPQIERTKVIGMIALPGAMTGMLLAGADPLSAVLVQLIIAYLVLGSVGVATTVIATAIAARAFTRDLRLAPWVLERPG
ncbi:MAG: ABC transporter permease [Acidimicrobiia bacterium]